MTYLTVNENNINNKQYSCPCGAILKSKYLVKKHHLTKRHMSYVENGTIYKKVTSAEYQRNRFAKSDDKRDRQRSICRQYYWNNKDSINNRHAVYRQGRKGLVAE